MTPGSKILSTFPLNYERSKCRCCGGDILYDNTVLRLNKNSQLSISGKSYRTVKKINDKIYPLTVCQKCLLKNYPNITNLNRIFNVMTAPTKFAFDIPDDVYNNSRRKYALTKDHLIEKYGEKEGTKRWESYCHKQSITNTFEYKNNKYGMTRSEFDVYNRSRAITLSNLIKKHGEKVGNIMWDKYCSRQRETKSLNYLLQNKPSEEVKRILDCRFKGINNASFKCYSNISQKLFSDLDKYLGNKYTTYYYSKNQEKIIQCDNNIYLLDYYIEELNICIEFYGDFWHANPLKYNENDFIPIINKTAHEIWEKDKLRIKNLQEKTDIKTYIIWEKEYNNQFNIESFIKNVLCIDIFS